MAERDVRIVTLGSLRVLSFHGYGTRPEDRAFKKVEAWMRKTGAIDDPGGYRIFGFNNPNPSEGTPEYGYEVWMTIGPEQETEVRDEVNARDDLALKDFEGGLYAVMRCEVRSGEEIPGCWQRLVAWLTGSSYEHAHHQWLEEHLWTGDNLFTEESLTLDLYAPIRSL
jgi:DNA gyrase inhibitor GyrI